VNFKVSKWAKWAKYFLSRLGGSVQFSVFSFQNAREVHARVDFYWETVRSPRLDDAVDAGFIHLSKSDRHKPVGARLFPFRWAASLLTII